MGEKKKPLPRREGREGRGGREESRKGSERSRERGWRKKKVVQGGGGVESQMGITEHSIEHITNLDTPP